MHELHLLPQLHSALAQVTAASLGELTSQTPLVSCPHGGSSSAAGPRPGTLSTKRGGSRPRPTRCSQRVESTNWQVKRVTTCVCMCVFVCVAVCVLCVRNACGRVHASETSVGVGIKTLAKRLLGTRTRRCGELLQRQCPHVAGPPQSPRR